MVVVQASDFHVVAPGRLAYGRIDTSACLAHAVSAINQLDPQPDLVIGSGDLVQSGDPAEYAALRAILSNLTAPFLPAPGNHDSREAWRAAFADLRLSLGPDRFLQYAVDFDGLKIVVLDTVTEGSDEASFCALRAEWLDKVLTASEDPVLIVTHHPPFVTGIPWMDPPTLAWTQGLRAVIEAHPGKVVGLISGHIHRAIHTRFAGVAASSCPSTAHQLALDFNAAAPLFSNEAPGFQLHRWDGQGLTTYTACLEGFGDHFAPPPSGQATPHV